MIAECRRNKKETLPPTPTSAQLLKQPNIMYTPIPNRTQNNTYEAFLYMTSRLILG